MPGWSFLLAMGAQCSDQRLEAPDAAEATAEARLEVEPARIDFGLLEPGAEATASFRITSTGTAAARIDALEVDGSSAFTLAWAGPGTDLPPGASTDVLVTYRPASVADAAWVEVTSTAEAPAVELAGAGAWPALAFDPAEVVLTTLEGVVAETEVEVRNVGNAPLELDDLVVQAEGFALEVDLPAEVEPGASLPVAVRFTPPGPDAVVDGTAWLAANTPSGSHALPLRGEVVPECLGLPEALDRGFAELSATTSIAGSSIRLRNVGDIDVCLDRWTVVLSDLTQDAAIGDPLGDTGAVYPLGSIRVEPGDEIFFRYAYTSVPAWWCVEQTQVTASADDFLYTGAQPPDGLRDLLLAADQDAIWAWQATNPVVLVGRSFHYVDLEADPAEVELVVTNLGGVDGVAEVRETLPPGLAALDVTPPPDREEATPEGGTTLVWSVAVGAREETDLDLPTRYDFVHLRYAVTGTCEGRTLLDAPQADWTDADGAARHSEGSPLVLACPGTP